MSDAEIKPRLFIGGLMRCCIETWDEKVKDAPQTEGQIIPCNWCESSMIFKDGAWRWNHEYK
jgi:hypothetical protein